MKKTIGFISEYPMIVIFFALCVCMLAGYIVLPEKDFSDMENRYLQKRPDVTAAGLLDGSFMDTFGCLRVAYRVFRKRRYSKGPGFLPV